MRAGAVPPGGSAPTGLICVVSGEPGAGGAATAGGDDGAAGGEDDCVAADPVDLVGPAALVSPAGCAG